jgi:hypothetical protein
VCGSGGLVPVNEEDRQRIRFLTVRLVPAGQKIPSTMRLLILLMVLCCDPMAIVLVIAASARR